MAKAVITLATCASREVCRPDVWKSFYSYSSPSFPSSSNINLLIRPYFISAAPLGGERNAAQQAQRVLRQFGYDYWVYLHPACTRALHY